MRNIYKLQSNFHPITNYGLYGKVSIKLFRLRVRYTWLAYVVYKSVTTITRITTSCWSLELSGFEQSQRVTK